VELFIIRVMFAIYYFLHFNTVRQVAARLQAKSAIYDCLVKRLREVFRVNARLTAGGLQCGKCELPMLGVTLLISR